MDWVVRESQAFVNLYYDMRYTCVYFMFIGLINFHFADASDFYIFLIDLFTIINRTSQIGSRILKISYVILLFEYYVTYNKEDKDLLELC